jgi:serine/threonine protein kinase
MGVVYEAIQLSLNRRVALKVLPFAGALDAQHLARFRLEAQAAAQLHHTTIVPVFAVGSERGVHYYATHYIEGKTLAEVIDEYRRAEGAMDPRPSRRAGTPSPGGRRLAFRPLPPGEGGRRPGEGRMHGSASAPPSPRTRAFFRTVATLGIQAAEALEHAHRFGILHRDIKPANLLVDVHGNLWITDFGLARYGDDASLTLTGDVLGTLRYMSPEQALGHPAVIDQRSDVYSLGVTLYELLTLRPAFPGRDRQEVLRQVAFDEPRTPRKINPAIPRELETIVRKAMSQEPGSRYTTAQEFADDLRRFLEHKPIKARRPNLLEWTAQWTRRHATAVGAALAFLVIAVLVYLPFDTRGLHHRVSRASHTKDPWSTRANGQ